VYTYRPAENPTFDTTLLRINYASPVTPDSVFDFDMDTQAWHLRKRKPVLGGYDPQNYAVRRLAAAAQDGAQVPISLVYRKDLPQDGPAPCLLYGYGAYGYSMEPGFNMNALSLVDRGFIYAIAHIRGGQELGRQWYEQGKFLQKKNTFSDFVACGRHLIEQKYTSPDQLAIEGRSAGGLLIGAVLNMAPDLCRAAVAGVPFVDVVTTMLDESIPLTVGEFEEWGNPKDPEYYAYMLSYSPYDNLAPRSYPYILATSGLNDPRVQYWEPTKWVARLRSVQRGDSRVLLKTNTDAGHSGASGRYDSLRDKAFEYAFILDSLGMGG
jgi:oligopeptidase B